MSGTITQTLNALAKLLRHRPSSSEDNLGARPCYIMDTANCYAN